MKRNTAAVALGIALWTATSARADDLSALNGNWQADVNGTQVLMQIQVHDTIVTGFMGSGEHSGTFASFYAPNKGFSISSSHSPNRYDNMTLCDDGHAICGMYSRSNPGDSRPTSLQVKFTHPW